MCGNYLCYREINEDKVNFEVLSLTEKEQKDKPDSYKSYIDLRPMFTQDERLSKYVTFDGIKEDSYLRFKELELHQRMLMDGKKIGEDQEYKPRHLLNLTVSNTSYVFDLDATIEKKLEASEKP